MARNGGAAMGEDDPNKESEEDFDAPNVPAHSPLPPPPEVTYQRPDFIRPASTEAGPRTSGSTPGGGADLGSHGAALGAGLSFVVSILAGAFIGNLIDQKWNHSSIPWATLVMILIGAAAGLLNLQRMLARMNRNRK
jgi:hypothetical protein